MNAPVLVPRGERHARLFRPHRRTPHLGDVCARDHPVPLPPRRTGDEDGAYGVTLEGVGPLCWPCAVREAPPHVVALVRAMSAVDRALTVAPVGWQLDVLAAAHAAVDAVTREHGI